MTDKKIRIILDSKDAEKNAKSLDKSVVGVGKAADKSQFSLNKLAAAIGAVIAVDKIKDYADAFTGIQNQLRRTTDNQNQLNESTLALLKIANDTRTGLLETTELYTSLAISTKNLGYTQEQVFGLTKTLNNLFLESGKSAEESAGAIRQLGQALQSGALRGDEFNSIAEGAPGILRAIQVETGKSAAELRKFAAEGGITAELLTKSLQNYADKAQEAADKTKVTLAQSFKVAENNATVFIGKINDATGFTNDLAVSIVSLSEKLASQENIDNFILFFKQSSKAINGTTEELKKFSNELDLLSDIGGESISLIGRAFRDIVPNIKASIQIITIEVLSALEKIEKFKSFFFEAMSTSVLEIGKPIDEFKAKLDSINQNRQDSITQIIAERDAIINSAKAEIKAKNDAAAAGGGANSNFGNQGTPSAPATPTKEQLAEAKKAYKELLDIQSQFWDAVDDEGKRSDAAEREIAGSKAVTEQLRIELGKRQQIAQIYKEQAISSENDMFAQQRAMQEARQLEEMANVQAEAALQAQRREEQLRIAIENENLTESERLRIKNEYYLQEQLQSQINQQQLTAIEEEGKRARIELARAERDAKVDLYSNLANTSLQIFGIFGKKSFQAQKNLAIAEGTVAVVGGVAKALNNPYPANLGFAAQVALQGAKLIQTIKSTNVSGGGGGGIGNVGGGSAGSSQIPETKTTQQTFQQKQVIEVRGIGPDSLITGAQLVDILQKDDNVIVALSGAQQDAQRRGVI